MAKVQYIFIGSLGTTKGIRCPLRLYTGMTEPGNQYIYVDLLHVMSMCVWLLQCELAVQKKIIALLNGGA